MIRTLWAALLASLAFSTAAIAQPRLDSTSVGGEASLVVSLAPFEQKIETPRVDAAGRLRVGTVRALAKAAEVLDWNAVPGGYATRIDSTSKGALGLRVKLEVPASASLEVRAIGDNGQPEFMTVDGRNGPESWTPWTEGATQRIEIFSREPLPEGAVRVGAMLHFTESPFAKAAASCTLSTACTTGDTQLDAALAERKKSTFKIQFISNGSGFVCTATLIDTPRKPTPYALTANHCLDTNASASSVTTFWFYEQSSCTSTLQSASTVQQAGGAQLTFTNFNIDSTLFQLNTAPPAGALYAPMNPAVLAKGQSVVSVSHPRGDSSHWATGTTGDQLRDSERPYNMYSVNFSRGIIEPGSSGSGIFTMANGHLELRGVLSQGSIDLSCSNPTAFTLYGRLEAFYPQMAQYIGAATAASDDAPNRPQDLFSQAADPNGADNIPLNLRGSTLALDNRRIDYAGDIDVYRFTLTAPAYVSAWTEGSLDTVGTILDSAGAAVTEGANDDADWVSSNNNNFGITKQLAAGVYYLHVANWVPTGTGTYNVRLRADSVDKNYTDLWWNAAEPGWGLNVNHQANAIFATLFTYDSAGAPMWLVMSAGARQNDGSYQGSLYRTSGPAFNAVPFGSVTLSTVGSMRITFTGDNSATLTYTVNGVEVTKSITRQVFGSPPTCTWSAFDRASSSNFQDLWWNPAEPGWGLNITQQGNKMFATLFTYGSDGRGVWLVMSDGNKSISGAFTGSLYRTSGPAFNASPWSPASVSQVGTMSLNFANGDSGTLTYSFNGTSVTKTIERQAFGPLKPHCES